MHNRFKIHLEVDDADAQVELRALADADRPATAVIALLTYRSSSTYN